MKPAHIEALVRSVAEVAREGVDRDVQSLLQINRDLTRADADLNTRIETVNARDAGRRADNEQLQRQLAEVQEQLDVANEEKERLYALTATLRNAVKDALNNLPANAIECRTLCEAALGE